MTPTNKDSGSGEELAPVSKGRYKVDEATGARIAELYKSGRSVFSLAKQFKLNRSTIYWWIHGKKTWKEYLQQENREGVGCIVRTHGLADTPVYYVWRNMRRRCTDPKILGYERYGGRGIKVCGRWENSFEEFYADMGQPPKGLTIDRKDNNGNYSCGKCAECIANGWPANCKWSTRHEQRINQRPRKRKATLTQQLNDMEKQA